MRAPVLKIRKKVLDIQGQMRPCVQVQAVVDDEVREILEKNFSGVILFKRAMYAAGIPEGTPKPEAALMPLVNNFIKNEACPELSVKSILSGQLYQAKDPWEVLCFEWIGKRSFDALVLMIICATEMGTETEYAPLGNEPLSANVEGGAEDAQSPTPVLTEAA